MIVQSHSSWQILTRLVRRLIRLGRFSSELTGPGVFCPVLKCERRSLRSKSGPEPRTPADTGPGWESPL